MKTKSALGNRLVKFALGSLVIATAPAQTVSDDFESGLSLWQATGQWGLTTGLASSPSHSVTDTPGAFYSNNTDTTLSLTQTIDLNAVLRPALAFHHAHDLEKNYDFAQVEISTDNGVTWLPSPLASYTGSRAAMTREQLDLSAFSTSSNVKIRFRLVTDSSVVMDGWYLDDVVIGSAPVAVTLQSPTGPAVSQTTVSLTWSASSDLTFESYVILRGTTEDFDWRTAKTVAVITNPNTTACLDIAVAPKTAYRYKVMTLSSAGLHSLSNEVTASTPAGIDYPFLDDGEAGPNLWTATSPWALSDEDFQSPGHAWSDSPGGNYTNGISSQPLTLAAPLDLTTSIDPVLTFHHRYVLVAGDTANVEISTNLGSSWSVLATYTTSNSPWNQTRIPLSAYTGQSSVLVRFRLTTNASENADGWHVDDISVAEAPPTVAAPAVDEISSHTLRLTWNTNSYLPFSHYAIHRSTNPGVGINSPRVAVISNQAQSQFTDTALALDTMYYYRVYAVSPYGTYSADSSNETIVRTLNNPLPFTENFDENLLSWNFGSDSGANAWGLSTEVKRNGAAALGSSPGASYAQNSNTWAETAVDLRNTEWPVLTFWDRYGLSTGDWIRLEISGPGGPSLSIYGAYESSRGEWQRQRVDLSQWKGLSNVKLRFHLVADNAPTPGEGWFIDDLNVSENPNRNTPLVLPFTEDFESGATGWLLSNWSTPDDAAAKDGNAVLRFGAPTRRISPDCEQWAVLDRPIILPPGSKVQATYWVRGKLEGNAYQRLHYSSNGGTGWAEFASVNLNPGFDSLGDWKRSQASLETLAGQSVRLRLSLYGIWSTVPFTDISIDKLTLAQIPQPVALSSAVPSLRSVDLTWTESSLGGAFVRYEVWRSTTADVSLTNGQKIFETTLPGTTLCTDTGLNIGGTYFYKVFTVDDRDTYTPSNELSTTTVPVAITFDDPMDSMDNWVTYSNTSSAWSVRTDEKHGGTGSLAAVPVGQYAQATDSYIETAVDLRNTEWPVLTFWDRYGLSTGDWIRLEISGPGGPSLSIYGAYESSRGEWQRQRVDLSQWKGLSNVKLRFHLVADNAPTPGEGWFIDDLNVSENPNRNTPLVLPFTEDFESGATGWLLSNWSTPDDAAAKDGNAVLRFGAPTRRISPDCEQWAVLDRPIILPPGSKVQATYWVRGKLEGNAYQRLHYSSNGGTGWAEFASVNLNPGFDSLGDWKRSQASLETLAGQSVRLRLSLYGIWSTVPFTDISIDKLTLAQIPQPVAMLPIDEVNVTSMKLHWIPSSIDSFQRYEVYRSTSADVTNASTLVATLTDKQIAEFADSGLQARSQYFYRVYVVDMRDTYSPSEVVSSTTLGVPLPFADDFATPQPGWTFTGQWQIQPGVGRNGSAALVDSPGDYLASTDNDCRFAINLDGTQWPILRYWDKHNFAGSSWGRVEVSTDNASWSLLNGVTGIRDAWQMQEIDLSPWKTQTRVFIRFHRATDGNLADGWTIDDLSVADRSVTTAYPVFEGFESGTSNWLSGSWAAIPDSPYAGASCLQDTVNHRYSPDTPNIITFSKEVDLTNTTNPQLTFFIRGLLDSYGNFRVQVSSNGGLSWGDISSLNRDTGFNSAIWIKQQASLAPWKGSKIRIRFVTTSYWSTQPTSDIFLDNIGIGEPSPGEPSPVIPFQNETVQIVRPTLTVTNAIDHQSDPLTHQFEVYADALLTQLVAEIPAVASGVSSTSWQVDIDLPDHAPYWWRARASDGTNTGPWCAPIVFNINEFNNSPPAVVIASPANDSLLIDGNGLLVWFQTSDPDLGDQILDYQIQIDDDYLFGSPEVDSSGITVDLSTFGPGFFASVPLSSLPGTSTLPSGRWFWRIRARDTRFASGAWPTAYAYFRLPTPYQRYLRSIYPDPEWFLDDVINPGVDPDGNGVGALVEFASAIAPGAAPGDRLPRPIENETAGLKYQGFEWTRRKNSELIFLLDFSTDLKNWQADDRANVEILHSVDDISERVRIIDPDPIGSHGNRFLRLRVRD